MKTIDLTTILTDWLEQDKFLSKHFEIIHRVAYYTSGKPRMGMIRAKCLQRWVEPPGLFHQMNPVVARTLNDKLILSEGIHGPAILRAGDPDFFDKLAKELYSKHNMTSYHCKYV